MAKNCFALEKATYASRVDSVVSDSPCGNQFFNSSQNRNSASQKKQIERTQILCLYNHVWFQSLNYNFVWNLCFGEMLL